MEKSHETGVLSVPGKLGWLVTTVWGFCAWIWSILATPRLGGPRREIQSHGPALGSPLRPTPSFCLIFNILTDLLRAGDPWCLAHERALPSAHWPGKATGGLDYYTSASASPIWISNKPVFSMEARGDKGVDYAGHCFTEELWLSSRNP